MVALDERRRPGRSTSLVADGAQAIAVCFLWSFLNDDHERRVGERIACDHPGIYVTASSSLAPVLGEYERAVTTAVNAYVGPRVVDYLERLAARLADGGYAAPLLLAHSMGGLTTMEDVRAKPLLMLDSGPVSGVLGARFFGAAYGEANILCADMGGTTFDVAMIEGGRSVLDEQPVIDKYAYLMPKVAVSSVGAGGGSIVWLDENGLLRVGPDSAGADPGPACYGRGGARLTVTDVDLILGFLAPGAFLGGRMRLDLAAAERAADRARPGHGGRPGRRCRGRVPHRQRPYGGFDAALLDRPRPRSARFRAFRLWRRGGDAHRLSGAGAAYRDRLRAVLRRGIFRPRHDDRRAAAQRGSVLPGGVPARRGGMGEARQAVRGGANAASPGCSKAKAWPKASAVSSVRST